MWWQLNFRQRMKVIIFFGNVPRHVRFVKTKREKERPFVSPGQLRYSIVRDGGVGYGFVATFDNAEFDRTDAVILNSNRNTTGAIDPSWTVAGAAPLFRKAKAAVPELAHAQGFVTRILELQHERFAG